LLDHWQTGIADGIRAMQQQGDISPDTDPDQAAAALLAGIQGGVVFLLATGRITHLEAALDRSIAALHA
jgi:tetracycline repressor-like protein